MSHIRSQIHHQLHTLDEASPEELAAAEQHILNCQTCRKQLRALDAALRALDHYRVQVATEFYPRHELFACLMDSPNHRDRLALVQLDELYHHWGLAQLLLDTSRQVRMQQPTISLEHAELALAISQRLDPGFYDGEWIADLRALARAETANAESAQGRLLLAAERLEQARQDLEAGTGRVPPALRVDLLEARLLRHRARSTEAFELLERALGQRQSTPGTRPSRPGAVAWLIHRLQDAKDFGLGEE